jgi:hypothetical protein
VYARVYILVTSETPVNIEVDVLLLVVVIDKFVVYEYKKNTVFNVFRSITQGPVKSKPTLAIIETILRTSSSFIT